MSMSRSEIITTLQGEYALKRERNQRQLEEREQRVRERSPEIGRLLDENRALLMDSSRAALKNPAKAREIMERARASAQQNRSRMEDLLEAAGFPRDALELQYDCPECRDTGYVGQPVKRFCKCFERRMMSLAYENANMAGLEQQCFENSNLTVFPDEPTELGINQRRMMAYAFQYGEEYAQNFPDNSKRNLLLYGPSGLGKTYLLNCIARRVLDRGFSVLKVTAYRMLEGMRKAHMGEDDQGELRMMMECELLLIDDLGTEPLLRNVSLEYLFTLFNERMVNRRHTVVATNLTPNDILTRYNERIYSRMVDQESTQVFQFAGRDVRTRGGSGR